MAKKPIPGTPNVGPKPPVVGQGTPPDPFRPSSQLGPVRPGQLPLDPEGGVLPPNWQDPQGLPAKAMGAQPGPYPNPNRSYWYGLENEFSLLPKANAVLQPPSTLPDGFVQPPAYSTWFLEKALHGLSTEDEFMWNWWRSPIFDFRPDLGPMGNDQLNTIPLNRPFGAGFQFALVVRPLNPVDNDGAPQPSYAQTFDELFSDGITSGLQRPRCFIWEEASISQSVDTLYQFEHDSFSPVNYGMLPIQNSLTDVTADVYAGSYQSIIKMTPPPSRYYRVNFLIDNGNNVVLTFGGVPWPVFRISGAVY